MIERSITRRGSLTNFLQIRNSLSSKIGDTGEDASYSPLMGLSPTETSSTVERGIVKELDNTSTSPKKTTKTFRPRESGQQRTNNSKRRSKSRTRRGLQRGHSVPPKSNSSTRSAQQASLLVATETKTKQTIKTTKPPSLNQLRKRVDEIQEYIQTLKAQVFTVHRSVEAKQADVKHRRSELARKICDRKVHQLELNRTRVMKAVDYLQKVKIDILVYMDSIDEDGSSSPNDEDNTFTAPSMPEIILHCEEILSEPTPQPHEYFLSKKWEGADNKNNSTTTAITTKNALTRLSTEDWCVDRTTNSHNTGMKTGLDSGNTKSVSRQKATAARGASSSFNMRGVAASSA